LLNVFIAIYKPLGYLYYDLKGLGWKK
jgi:hypothetical protein